MGINDNSWSKPCFREMYHGRNWMSDNRFFTPMVASQCAGHIFVNDFIKYITGHGFKIAKVKTFFRRVSVLATTLIFLLINIMHRKEKITYMLRSFHCIQKLGIFILLRKRKWYYCQLSFLFCRSLIPIPFSSGIVVRSIFVSWIKMYGSFFLCAHS